jgi:glycosyltransferase involved in cell wall biosynthesis
VTRTKTCVVVTSFAEGQPGFLDFAYRIKSLATHYVLTVISTQRLTQTELQIPNVNYVVLDGGVGRMGWFGYIWRCAKWIRKERPAVAVLLHSMAAPVALFVGGVPTATYWNEHPTHVAPVPNEFSLVKSCSRAVIRWLMYQGARSSTLVMPIGEAHRDDLINHGCMVEQLHMLYMGVDPLFAGAALSQSSETMSGAVKLIYVGSVHEDRGRDVMLESIAIANQGGEIAHLTIVGASDEQAEYCNNKVASLGIRTSVRIVGRVPGYEIPAHFSEADVGICLWKDLPWFRFNPPTKLFEYLVAGLPVLASNIRTHTQYIKDGDNGLIFDYTSTALAQAIHRLHSDRQHLGQMKERAVTSSSVYLWPAIESKFLETVDAICR